MERDGERRAFIDHLQRKYTKKLQREMSRKYNQKLRETLHKISGDSVEEISRQASDFLEPLDYRANFRT